MRRLRDVCLLGLVLGLSGCAGMQQRLASHPGDPEGSGEPHPRLARGPPSPSGGRIARPHPARAVGDEDRREDREAAHQPSARGGLSLFPRHGPSGRGRGRRSGPGPEPARADPLGIRTSAKQDAGNRPVSGGGPDAIRGRTPFLAAGGLECPGPPRRPVEPLPRRAQRGQARRRAVRTPCDILGTSPPRRPGPSRFPSRWRPRRPTPMRPRIPDSAAVDPSPAEEPNLPGTRRGGHLRVRGPGAARPDARSGAGRPDPRRGG